MDKNSCPICRKPVAEEADARPKTSRGVSNRTWDRSSFADEFRVRLGSISRMYPDHVTPSMVNQWETDYRLGRGFDYASHRRFHHYPEGPSRMSSSGSFGNFGGGSSHSGGGAGGGW